MSIVITIEGNHPTDVLAQLKTLSEGLSGQQSAPVAVNVERKIVETQKQEVEVSRVDDSNSFDVKPKKLVGKEHKTEADKMIQAGEKNEEIFPLLSKKQQDRVEEALNPKDLGAPVEEEVIAKAPQPEKYPSHAPVNEGPFDEPVEEITPDVGGLFDDEPEVVAPTVSLESIKELITSKARKDGKDVPEMYAAIRAEIRNLVGKEEEPKISNVPESKYADLYQAIKSL